MVNIQDGLKLKPEESVMPTLQADLTSNTNEKGSEETLSLTERLNEQQLNKKVIDYKNDESDDSDTEKEYLSNELKKTSKVFSLHKASHSDLGYDDIKKIIDDFNIYCSKI